MGKKLLTIAYGFPRLGEKREYKKLIEAFWNRKIKEEELKREIFKLEEEILALYKSYVDKFPVGEMSFYDNILDTAIMVGLYKVKDLNEYFSLCRGEKALTLTKWFNTNYHYLVPDFPKNFKPGSFKISWQKPKEELESHKKGIPSLIGPFTFLKLSKGISKKNFEKYLLALSEIYSELIKDFKEVFIEEPAFVLELSEREIESIKKAYKKIPGGNQKVYLLTYYETLDFLKELYDLPFSGIGLDFLNGKGNLQLVQKFGFPKEKILICGLVQGRNIWKTEFSFVIKTLHKISKYAKNLAISNSCPLFHLPVTIENEKELPKELLERISFAKERLRELNLIAKIWEGKEKLKPKKGKRFGINKEVRMRIKKLKNYHFKRKLPYEKREKIQREILKLPLFPTTTIGSYPQTPEIRKKRREFLSGKISQKEYQKFIEEKIKEVIRFQEETGLDVLVHGEFERSDMVEFFAQKLEGFITTKNGWILSYGTRVYRPPIIYGDVWRKKPLTQSEITFAQSLTKKPVKGMLTCPITILAWSFPREDIPWYEVAFQIALCLRDEIKDYEKNGIKIVQLDEPAFREKAPLKKRYWKEYFHFAIKAFNLVAGGALPKTKIQSHMCYSEFGEIIEYISKLEFDSLLIEASRSKGEIIDSFKRVKFQKEIGLGVWDIHSPKIPKISEMKRIINYGLKIFPPEKLWINPDCGLKTRRWEEIRPALKNLVRLAHLLRAKFEK